MQARATKQRHELSGRNSFAVLNKVRCCNSGETASESSNARTSLSALDVHVCGSCTNAHARPVLLHAGVAMKAGAHARRLLQAAMDENLILPEAPSNRQAQADMLARYALMALLHGATSAGALDAALLAVRCLMAMLLPVANSGLQARSGSLRICICIAGSRSCWLRSISLLWHAACRRTRSSAAWSSQACR